MNVAAFILRQLASWDVRHIYGVIGDAILPFMDEVAKQAAIRFIPVRHESAAGFMASAEAKLTGRLAVCVGTSGPGIANLVNGISDAYADRVPLLVLTGQVESYKVGTRVKQEVNQQAMMQALTGYTSLLAGPTAIPDVLTRALRTALGEGRVAQISVPKDYWMAGSGTELKPRAPYLTQPPVAAPEVLARAGEILRGATRPLILAGDGARPAAGDLLRLAEVWSAGVVLALGGKGMLDGNHPLVLGGVGTGGSEAAHRALKACDMVLVAGSTWWPKPYMPEGVPVVQIDCIPTNIGEKVPGAFGLAGDAREVIPALLVGLRTGASRDRSAWTGQLAAWKQEWQATVDREATAAPAEGPVPPAAIVRAVQGVAPPGSIITLDTGDHLLWFNRHFPGNGHRLLFSGTWRSMGYGLPAATAAKLCDPGARVLALVGDGGLTMLLGELAVPVQQNLDLTVVVFRNNSLALEAFKAQAEGFVPFGHQLNNPDFAAVARAFGWQAWRVDRAADLEGALEAAVSHPGPALVDVWTAADPSLHTGGGGT